MIVAQEGFEIHSKKASGLHPMPLHLILQKRDPGSLNHFTSNVPRIIMAWPGKVQTKG